MWLLFGAAQQPPVVVLVVLTWASRLDAAETAAPTAAPTAALALTCPAGFEKGHFSNASSSALGGCERCPSGRYAAPLSKECRTCRAGYVPSGGLCFGGTPYASTFNGTTGTHHALVRERRGSCYFFAPRSATWTDAERVCRGLGGHLACLGGQDEAQFVASKAHEDMGFENYWIGLNERGNARAFDWTNPKCCSEYRNWYNPARGDGATTREPNEDIEAASYRCVRVDARTETLHDENCRSTFHFLCEAPITSASTSCAPCRKGTYARPGFAECTSCDFGTFAAEDAAGQCTPCPSASPAALLSAWFGTSHRRVDKGGSVRCGGQLGHRQREAYIATCVLAASTPLLLGFLIVVLQSRVAGWLQRRGLAAWPTNSRRLRHRIVSVVVPAIQVSSAAAGAMLAVWLEPMRQRVEAWPYKGRRSPTSLALGCDPAGTEPAFVAGLVFLTVTLLLLVAACPVVDVLEVLRRLEDAWTRAVLRRRLKRETDAWQRDQRRRRAPVPPHHKGTKRRRRRRHIMDRDDEEKKESPDDDDDDDDVVVHEEQSPDCSFACVLCGLDRANALHLPCRHCLFCLDCAAAFRAEQGPICATCRQPADVVDVRVRTARADRFYKRRRRLWKTRPLKHIRRKWTEAAEGSLFAFAGGAKRREKKAPFASVQANGVDNNKDLQDGGYEDVVVVVDDDPDDDEDSAVVVVRKNEERRFTVQREEDHNRDREEASSSLGVTTCLPGRRHRHPTSSSSLRRAAIKDRFGSTTSQVEVELASFDGRRATAADLRVAIDATKRVRAGATQLFLASTCGGCGRASKLVVHLPCGHATLCAACAAAYRASRGDGCPRCKKKADVLAEPVVDLACSVCYEEASAKYLVALGPCGHILCTACGVFFVRSALADVASQITKDGLRCPLRTEVFLPPSSRPQPSSSSSTRSSSSFSLDLDVLEDDDDDDHLQDDDDDDDRGNDDDDREKARRASSSSSSPIPTRRQQQQHGWVSSSRPCEGVVTRAVVERLVAREVQPESREDVLPLTPEEFDRLTRFVFEASIPPEQRFHCCHTDCARVFAVENLADLIERGGPETPELQMLREQAEAVVRLVARRRRADDEPDDDDAPASPAALEDQSRAEDHPAAAAAALEDPPRTLLARLGLARGPTRPTPSRVGAFAETAETTETETSTEGELNDEVNASENDSENDSDSRRRRKPAAAAAAGPPPFVTCPFCKRRSCVRCRTPAHTLLTCEEVQSSAPSAHASTALLYATSRPCPNCGFFVTHYHGHACHHIRPGSGCPSCGTHWCYSCGSRGTSGRACGCALFCDNDDVVANLVALPFPYDRRCSCPICPDCRPGAPCAQCTGSCVVCRGILPPGPSSAEDVDTWADAVVDHLPHRRNL